MAAQQFSLFSAIRSAKSNNTCAVDAGNILFRLELLYRNRAMSARAVRFFNPTHPAMSRSTIDVLHVSNSIKCLPTLSVSDALCDISSFVNALYVRSVLPSFVTIPSSRSQYDKINSVMPVCTPSVLVSTVTIFSFIALRLKSNVDKCFICSIL